MNRSNNKRIMFIRATAHASARIRRRICEHGREGFVDDGVGIIIASNGVPYADLDNTLFRAVATLDRELAARSTETEGFNVAGFIGALVKAQDLRGS